MRRQNIKALTAKRLFVHITLIVLAALVILPSPAWATSFVQSKVFGCTAGCASTSGTMASPVNAGDMIAVSTGASDASVARNPTVSDSQANSWTLAAPCLSANPNGADILTSCLYTAIAKTTSSDTFTVSCGSCTVFDNVQATAAEFASASQIINNTVAGSCGSGCTTSIATSPATFAPGVLLISISSSYSVVTPSTGFTAITGLIYCDCGIMMYGFSTGVTSPTTFAATVSNAGPWSQNGFVFIGSVIVDLYAQNFPSLAIMATWVLTFIGILILPSVVTLIFKETAQGDVVVTVWLLSSLIGSLLGSMAATQADVGTYGYVPWGITFYVGASLVIWLVKGGGH